MIEASAFGRPGYATTRDGRRLHYVTAGDGGPPVVFEAGGSGSRTIWGLVQGEVARSAGTLSYDRAGFGRSEPDAAPRTLERIADDLEDLLGSVGGGPFVLVGHSLGGPICRLLAYRRPELVVGLVLVDQAAEDCDFYSGRALAALGAVTHLLTVPLAGLGIMGALAGRRLYRRFPPDMVAESRGEEFTTAALRAHRAEARHLAAGFRALRQVSEGRPLPDVPVTLISAAAGKKRSGGMQAQIAASHQRLARSHPQGRHVWAEGSGHMVPVEAPGVIVREVRALLSPS
ncbi:alpha/beta hydrolase fold precursor [Microtetraspora sp. NBRC 13810]|uniref:alpha/beta fold hydrolase n=1 Tax=Microtetraspora sp. NBRC 13810 TaxID=3030990 RepID=UPI0024A24EBA|nr:alpha/beta hydrolase [Microtetraspora sp. NBRC 13810]GLW08084.1 alpha/beta hydrolase fold precursor [Microtetraspora sp. NBRC 13810]